MIEHKIELEEAMRRTDAMLVRQGYRIPGRWTNKYYDDGEKEPLWSQALVGLENTRILLWKERDHWRAVISVAVGKDGEFPIAEAIILRTQDKFFPPMVKIAARLVDTQKQVYQWGFAPANVYSSQAMARLTEHFLSTKRYRKAKQINRALINGDINAATVSEALSMIQSLYCPSREDRLASALIWGEVYR